MTGYPCGLLSLYQGERFAFFVECNDMDDVILHHGDYLEYMRGMESGSFYIVTDPPYGIFACGGKWGKKDQLQWDRKPAMGIDKLVALGRESIIWGGNYFSLPPSRGWLVWHKRDAVPSAASVELAWTSLDMNSRIIDQTISATNPERCGHPTQKPIRVMLFSLSFLPKNITVFDPFMGSGTTGVACIQTGRRFIGCEIDENYFNLARKRIEEAQGIGSLFDPRNTEQVDLFSEVPDEV